MKLGEWKSEDQALRFFELLDLHSIGLEQTAEMVGQGEYEAAAEAYVAFLKNKFAGADPGFSERSRESAMSQADALLENKLSLLGSPLQDIGQPVDWVYYPDGDQQWQSHLGYMDYLESLIDAGRYTGEKKYADKWVALVIDFIDHHPWGTDRLSYSKRIPLYANEYVPVCGGEGFCPGYIGGSWISLGCAARTGRWIKGLPFLLSHDWISPVAACRVVQSLMTDHFYVMLNNPRKGTPNQFLHVASSLLELGITFWEFKAAPAGYLVGMQRFEEAIDKCVLPDGTDLEQSPNYNTGLPRVFNETYRIPELKGNRRMERLYQKIKQRCNYLALLTNPLGCYPDLAKTHGSPVVSMLRQYCELYQGLSEVGRVADALQKGSDDSALPRSVDFPYGGYSILRDSWERDSRYLLLKYSRWSPGHKHEDANSLVLTAFGRNMLVDTGNYNYSDDEHSQRIHSYLFAAKGHNTVDVDGLSQNRIAMDRGVKLDERLPGSTTNDREYDILEECLQLHKQPCPGIRYHSGKFDFVQGFYADGYGELGGCFERQVVYARGSTFIVVDNIAMEDTQTHRFTQHWHFAQEYHKEHFQLSENLIETVDPNGPNLWCRSFSKASLASKLYYGEKDPYRGWYVVEYNDMVPAAEVEYSWQGQGRQTVVTLLYPHLGMESGMRLEERASGFTAWLADGTELSFSWDEHGFVLQTDAAVLRFDGKNVQEE